MTLQQYQQETLRTFPDLGSEIYNSIHMTAGIVTELLELGWANENDIVDESGDAFWYISNYSNLHFIPLIYSEPNDESPLAPIEESLILAGQLLDFDKKKLAYNKLYNKDKQISFLNQLYSILSYDIIIRGHKLEEVFDKNIQKLRIRFPDKFSQELAINRDLEKEKEIFKN